jgi:hypothetical protein
MTRRVIGWIFALAGVMLLSGCADTERSWAYSYRYSFDAPTVTPRLSRTYHTMGACEEAQRKDSRAVDRCLPQPPITVYPIEWQMVITFASQERGQPLARDRMTLIMQTWRDCRTVRREYWGSMRAGLIASAERAGGRVTATRARITAGGRITIDGGGEGWATVAATTCRPVYIGDRRAYTPLHATDLGILTRSPMDEFLKRGEGP